MIIHEIEHAARIAWPALEEQETPFGVLRYARGADRRTNSLCLRAEAGADTEKLIGATERFFEDRNAVPVVRIVQAAQASLSTTERLDRALASRGYEKQAPTISMSLDLGRVNKTGCKFGGEVPKGVDLQSWLPAWYRLAAKPAENLSVHSQMLGKLPSPHLFLLCRTATGGELGTGLGVITGDAAGLFGIATAGEHRQQGHASRIVSSLLRWAVMEGARFAYLQVEEANVAAIQLYRKMGFSKSYRYWYRVGKATTKL